jgi:pimeloyl-ACP methyl ester carboxylesterase
MGFMPGGPVATAAVWAMLHFMAEGKASREVGAAAGREIQAVFDADSDGSRYATVTAPTLLLGGGRSPAYLQEVLPFLVETIPDAKLVITPEFDHNAPDLGGPKAVAELIRA